MICRQCGREYGYGDSFGYCSEDCAYERVREEIHDIIWGGKTSDLTERVLELFIEDDMNLPDTMAKTEEEGLW